MGCICLSRGEARSPRVQNLAGFRDVPTMGGQGLKQHDTGRDDVRDPEAGAMPLTKHRYREVYGQHTALAQGVLLSNQPQRLRT